ncbi:MAG: SRPBCC domain-containing protein [Reyranella sp.]|nr:SRPBCC domain-containing protein [Reyranella sp.]
MASKPSLALKRRLKAPPEKIYEAWTVPEKMIQWWGASDAPSRTAEADVRVGGRFHVGFRGNDDSQHDVGGIYREVVPNRRLVFSWAWRTTPERESQVTIDLKADGDSTILTLTHEQFVDDKARDDHVVGWTTALDNLERALA